MNLSQFPNNYDNFTKKTDISYNDVENVRRYQELKLKINRTLEEDNELNNLIIVLRDKLVLPDDWNILYDAMSNMQIFTKETLQNYFRYRGDWVNNPNPIYTIFNSVKYIDGHIYMAYQNPGTNNPTDTTKWLKITAKGEKGDQGSPGLGLTYRELFDIETYYLANDLVSWNGNTYYAKQNVNGVLPSDTVYWTPFMNGTGENLNNLKTKNKTNLVGAINEINTNTTEVLDSLSQTVTYTKKNTYLNNSTVRGNLQTKAKGNTYVNIAKNGNFINTDYWTGVNATISANNNILSITGNGSSNIVAAEQTCNMLPVIGKKVFVRITGRKTNSTGEMSISIKDDSQLLNVATQQATLINTWYTWYGIVSLGTSNTPVLSIRHTYANATTANGKIMEIAEVLMLDLSNKVELQNLTAQEINDRIPYYFDGIISVENALIKGQQVWTPNNYPTTILMTNPDPQINFQTAYYPNYITNDIITGKTNITRWSVNLNKLQTTTIGDGFEFDSYEGFVLYGLASDTERKIKWWDNGVYQGEITYSSVTSNDSYKIIEKNYYDGNKHVITIVCTFNGFTGNYINFVSTNINQNEIYPEIVLTNIDNTVTYSTLGKVSGDTNPISIYAVSGIIGDISTFDPKTYSANELNNYYSLLSFYNGVTYDTSNPWSGTLTSGRYRTFLVKYNLKAVKSGFNNNWTIDEIKKSLKEVSGKISVFASGANAGVRAYGVKIYTYVNNGWSLTHSEYTGQSPQLISGNYFSAYSTNLISSDGCTYFAIQSEYPSDGTIHSSVCLDSLDLKITFSKPIKGDFISNTVNIPFSLRDVPNGIKDEYNINTGWFSQKIGKTIITGSNTFNWGTITTLTNTYRAVINGWSTTNNALMATTTDHYREYNKDSFYNITSDINADIRSITIHSTDTNLYIKVEKSKIDAMTGATILDKFKAYLNQYQITLIYQLATSKFIQYPSQQLNYYQNELIYNDSIVRNIKICTNNTIVIDDISKPIIKMLYINEIDDNGNIIPLSLTGLAISSDKTSFSSSTLISGKYYEYGYQYNNILPTLEMIYPTTIKRQTDGNTNIIEQINSKINTHKKINDVNFQDIDKQFTTVNNNISVNTNNIATNTSNITTNTNSINTINNTLALRLDGAIVKLGANTNGTGDGSVIAGKNATTETAINATAVGHSTLVSEIGSLAMGAGSSARGLYSAGIMSDVINNYEIRIGEVYHTVDILGTVSAKIKAFEIPHPNPLKKDTHILRHSCIESPTEGDTLYRYTVEAIEDGQTIIIELPDYFQYLNKNVDVWVNGYRHFGKGYGEVIDDKLYVTCELVGKYKVLVIGTRNDDVVQNWSIKGVEREIGESWLGETYAFEVDEIIEITEIIEEGNY